MQMMHTVWKLCQLSAAMLCQAADVKLALALVADDHGAISKATLQEVRAVAQDTAPLIGRLARHMYELGLHIATAAPACIKDSSAHFRSWEHCHVCATSPRWELMNGQAPAEIQ